MYAFNPPPVGTVVETDAGVTMPLLDFAFNPPPVGTVVETLRVQTIAGIGIWR